MNLKHDEKPIHAETFESRSYERPFHLSLWTIKISTFFGFYMIVARVNMHLPFVDFPKL